MPRYRQYKDTVLLMTSSRQLTSKGAGHVQMSQGTPCPSTHLTALTLWWTPLGCALMMTLCRWVNIGACLSKGYTVQHVSYVAKCSGAAAHTRHATCDSSSDCIVHGPVLAFACRFCGRLHVSASQMGTSCCFSMGGQAGTGGTCSLTAGPSGTSRSGGATGTGT
jgi:hypothetical protein